MITHSMHYHTMWVWFGLVLFLLSLAFPSDTALVLLHQCIVFYCEHPSISFKCLYGGTSVPNNMVVNILECIPLGNGLMFLEDMC